MSYIPPSELVLAAGHFQPWVSPGLQPAIVQSKEAQALCFVHFETVCMNGQTRGTTTWVATTKEGRCAALTIPWAVVEDEEHDIELATNALTIASNLYVMDSSGRQAADHERMKVLNKLACRLRWQDVVREELAISQPA